MSISCLQYKITSQSGWKTIQSSLESTGLEFKAQLAQETSISPETIKILFKGKYLKDETTLAQQGITASVKLMVSGDAAQQKAITEYLETEKEDLKTQKYAQQAKKLASRSDGGSSGAERNFVELENQDGMSIQLDPQDRIALVTGMTLHEKGRAFLKDGDVKAAISLFTQADQEGFSKCSIKILSGIDNYGILCLDISWAYFKLQDPSFFKDASFRLATARSSLVNSHGQNFERINQLKKTDVAAELVLYTRLEILEGVLAYYQGNKDKAESFFIKAKEYLEKVKIDENDIRPLIEMGFTEKESRLAMRECSKDVNRAYEWIAERRQKEIERIAGEATRRLERQRMIKYGRSANGSILSAKTLEKLMEQGFQENLIVEGLRQTNSDYEKTLDLLIHNPEALMRKKHKKKKAAPVDNEKVHIVPDQIPDLACRFALLAGAVDRDGISSRDRSGVAQSDQRERGRGC
eukprot:TRINITY_DN520_c0_g1_i1.p1 TRINITY_DN520_c0_g1~~TRINITY_DN520_c0_g1_i1.p1  ORF type:complete len:500 (+),score=170.01 TRINITY_DN520_c0_g1_i1:105-1502(+)